MLNNREYLLELAKVAIHTQTGMKLWKTLNTILVANTSQLNGLSHEELQEIQRIKDVHRRRHNNKVYATEDALKYQHYIQFVDSKGMAHFRRMTKHDNVPGEETE